MPKRLEFDVVIIGAGAAGLMCAIEAGKRGRRTLVIDHANKIGKKILMSGGGRCNFTNLDVSATNYLSNNPHFCKSAFARYSPFHFLELVDKHNIPYREKTDSIATGQLFCEQKSADILNMLKAECSSAGVTIQSHTHCSNIRKRDGGGFKLSLENASSLQQIQTHSLVIASGGLSIPRMGASNFGYQLAAQFNIPVLNTRPGLVGLHLNESLQGSLASLSGLSLDVSVSCDGMTFSEAMLFTHKGISGPAILQISSYWQAEKPLEINLLPNYELSLLWEKWRLDNALLATHLSKIMPRRLVELWLQEFDNLPTRQYSKLQQSAIINKFHHWQPKVSNTDGYKTAEVTLGGVDTNAISSKTFAANSVAGLYFIGEVLDVTGWLGGYNFQWAWASGWCCGQVV
ncbi:MAG: NAD(P)/FAD-dependent oxidoreductase [Xanthomonadales bacterium]|nr:NAD(P)/FAD-dependent oxidoreductase [Xanthomonadales bacterium]